MEYLTDVLGERLGEEIVLGDPQQVRRVARPHRLPALLGQLWEGCLLVALVVPVAFLRALVEGSRASGLRTLMSCKESCHKWVVLADA